MKSLFDAMVYVKWHINNHRIAEKWIRVWDICAYGGVMLITEPLVYEIYQQIEKIDGRVSAANCIRQIKAFDGMKMYPEKEDDELTFEAAHLNRSAQNQGIKTISFIDAYLLAICIAEDATLYTTDHYLRDFAKTVNCEVEYLPLAALDGRDD